MSNNEKTKIYLQGMIKEIKFEDLPYLWNNFDITSFSKQKKLWDYQKEAIEKAIKVLWKYYEEFKNYQEGEDLKNNLERKKQFYKWYKDNELKEDLDIKLDNKNKKSKKNNENINLFKDYEDYFPIEEGKISYQYFINRMSFWMATGSGKTLVIVKLIEILNELIERKEIPPYNILFLTHRDDLIEQFKKHVDEFNQIHNKNHSKVISLVELKNYSQFKRFQSLFKKITVFYYRSDLISDEEKEKIINFKVYDNEGKWYIILDEAHKGDKEESKRQHIYSILSRNGFLFNFSATFTDKRDIVTCAHEFNLSSFIKEGYGKHIYLLKQEMQAFKEKKEKEKLEKEKLDIEKQKIVLKTFIIFTYIRKIYEEIRKIDSNLYHRPLILTLVNSVNTEDSDLKLFFREIEKIGKGEIEDEIFKESKEELLIEIKENPKFIFEEDQKLTIDKNILEGISKEDILNFVYNAPSFGDIEIIKNKSNNKELAFKLKTSDKPFALIKIGDISQWLKELIGKEIQETLRDQSFFETLNNQNSEINILMGSRSFYEGWDSNRPNIINFINIGIGKEEAKKFIIQSIGRGIRIEPIKDKRKRLINLKNSGQVQEDLFDQIKNKIQPIETLFIFATKRDFLNTIIQGLEEQKTKRNEIIKQLKITPKEEKQEPPLLIPVYKRVKILKPKTPSELGFHKEETELLKKFIDYIQDNRILLMKYNTDPIKIDLLRKSIKKEENENTEQKKESDNTKKPIRNIDIIIQKYLQYLELYTEEFDKIKELEDEIKHFKNIIISLEDINKLNELDKKIEKVANYTEKSKEEENLEEKFKKGEITIEQFIKEFKKINQQKSKGEEKYNELIIKYISKHYYNPVILSEKEKIDYIKHIIKVKSEVDFIKKLIEEIEAEETEKIEEEKEKTKETKNKFKDFDWWKFSKIDESLDEVYIPYYNLEINKISKFKPDFIFWLKKGDQYYIVFVDPKSIEFTDHIRKIEGFKKMFEENKKSKLFTYKDLKVKVKLFYYTNQKEQAPPKYKYYYIESITEMLEKILKEQNIERVNII